MKKNQTFLNRTGRKTRRLGTSFWYPIVTVGIPTTVCALGGYVVFVESAPTAMAELEVVDERMNNSQHRGSPSHTRADSRSLAEERARFVNVLTDAEVRVQEDNATPADVDVLRTRAREHFFRMFHALIAIERVGGIAHTDSVRIALQTDIDSYMQHHRADAFNYALHSDLPHRIEMPIMYTREDLLLSPLTEDLERYSRMLTETLIATLLIHDDEERLESAGEQSHIIP
jgi:hypothetical protein